ncbi:hypothetical protein BCR33DRAFT_712504 [Rhizoclosmatium globosum]|uniref:Uncharacterized protein n=1 Tax=Rhizoclosmatium globosum TaxID=329046 RepID=A0A1Y2CX90_9FUNG|nr:hypothetical protein BCR33DRAFT_712504 [Rhizoclosmatium globosum]|eukprot:ORY51454.1 hypothetical protein BCR33DRAFT_712504 [Rhizoclosmatium globosum]
MPSTSISIPLQQLPQDDPLLDTDNPGSRSTYTQSRIKTLDDTRLANLRQQFTEHPWLQNIDVCCIQKAVIFCILFSWISFVMYQLWIATH